MGWSLRWSGCQTAAYCCAIITHHFVKSVRQRGLTTKPPAACCWAPIWSEQEVGGQPSATWHPWFTPPDKESNWKAMKLSATPAPLQKNTTHQLPLLSQVSQSWLVWHVYNRTIFALQQWLSSPGWQVHIWKLYMASKWVDLQSLPTQVSEKEALLCQIFTLDTVTRLKGNVLVIVLSHFRGNNYLTASFGRENKFVSEGSWWATESPNDLWFRATFLQDTHQVIPRGNFVVL